MNLWKQVMPLFCVQSLEHHFCLSVLSNIIANFMELFVLFVSFSLGAGAAETVNSWRLYKFSTYCTAICQTHRVTTVPQFNSSIWNTKWSLVCIKRHQTSNNLTWPWVMSIWEKFLQNNTNEGLGLQFLNGTEICSEMSHYIKNFSMNNKYVSFEWAMIHVVTVPFNSTVDTQQTSRIK